MNAPALHYESADHVIGDVHPFFHDGTWYLYYLLPGGNYESALLVSNDLLHWEERGLVHEGEAPERPYFALGVFRTPDGLFRSYHGSAGGLMKAQESSDLRTWRNSDARRDIPPQPKLFEIQRDPFVFWNDADASYWCVMTARIRSGGPGANGAVAYASSPDLEHWTARGALYAPGAIGEPECPQMFRIGESWYLLASIYREGSGVGKPSYWMSADPNGPWRAARPDALDGEDLRAAQVAFDGSRWILLGWIRSSVEAWGGCICLPREVYRLDGGALATRLERGAARSVRAQPLFSLAHRGGGMLERGGWREAGGELAASGPARAVLQLPLERFDLDAAIDVDAPRFEAGLRLSTGAGELARVVVTGDDTGRALAVLGPSGEPISSIAVRPDEAREYRLRVIAEGDVVEVFLNDRYSLAARLPSARPQGAGYSGAPLPAALSLVTDSPARVRELSVYALATG